MSIEIYVLSDRCLASIEDWQRAIDAEGFKLRLDMSRAFADLGGHLLAQRGDEHAGFECDHWDPRDIIDTYEDIDFGRGWSRTLAFRIGGDFHALWGAYAAATAYARATDGVVFDSEAGEIFSPEQAAKTVRDIERSLPG